MDPKALLFSLWPAPLSPYRSRIAVLGSVLLLVTMPTWPANQALAAQTHAARHGHHPAAPGTDESAPTADETKPSAEQPAAGKATLDFDFFGGPAGAAGPGQPHLTVDPAAADIEAKSQRRRWMLRVHQTLGITTWALLASTVIIGQLNYNQLWGGGGGSQKYQTPHRWLVISTSVAFATTAGFSLLAPKPYDKPLRFDTGLIHRIAVIGATLGMVSEGVLGWVTTHEAQAGNPHSRTLARTHQIIGYSTLGLLTVAGVVWVF